MRLNIMPAYGRDYSSVKAIAADLAASRDFLVCDFQSCYDGKPINLPQLKELGVTFVQVRYARLRKVTTIKL